MCVGFPGLAWPGVFVPNKHEALAMPVDSWLAVVAAVVVVAVVGIATSAYTHSHTLALAHMREQG